MSGSPPASLCEAKRGGVPDTGLSVYALRPRPDLAGLEEDLAPDRAKPARAEGLSLEARGFLHGIRPVPKGVWDPDDTTSRLMLEAIERLGPSFFEGKRVLDTGTGSGILALSAVKRLGAAHAVATELAEIPHLHFVRAKAFQLEISGRIDTYQGDLLEPVQDQRFDVALFNAVPSEVERYVREVGSVLEPDGVALLMWNRMYAKKLKEAAQAGDLFIASILESSGYWRVYALARDPERLRFVRDLIDRHGAVGMAPTRAGLEEADVPRAEGVGLKELLDNRERLSGA